MEQHEWALLLEETLKLSQDPESDSNDLEEAFSRSLLTNTESNSQVSIQPKIQIVQSNIQVNTFQSPEKSSGFVTAGIFYFQDRHSKNNLVKIVTLHPNEDISSMQDFADNEKFLKWCTDKFKLSEKTAKHLDTTQIKFFSTPKHSLSEHLVNRFHQYSPKSSIEESDFDLIPQMELFMSVEMDEKITRMSLIWTTEKLIKEKNDLNWISLGHPAHFMGVTFSVLGALNEEWLKFGIDIKVGKNMVQFQLLEKKYFSDLKNLLIDGDQSLILLFEEKMGNGDFAASLKDKLEIHNMYWDEWAIARQFWNESKKYHYLQ